MSNLSLILLCNAFEFEQEDSIQCIDFQMTTSADDDDDGDVVERLKIEEFMSYTHTQTHKIKFFLNTFVFLCNENVENLFSYNISISHNFWEKPFAYKYLFQIFD